MPSKFPERAPRAGKAARGRTSVANTPIAIRSRVELKPGFEDRIRRELARKLGRSAPLVERGTVRFEDVNGPRGGVDTRCRIKLVMSGRPSVQVEQIAVNPATAFGRAVPILVRTLERTRRKHGLRAGPAARAPQRGRRAPVTVERGEIIGRRVGRGPDALARIYLF